MRTVAELRITYGVRKFVDQEFWLNRARNMPHIYDSVVVLEKWLNDQERTQEKGSLNALLSDHRVILGFLLGFLCAVLCFLPEIMGLKVGQSM